MDYKQIKTTPQGLVKYLEKKDKPHLVEVGDFSITVFPKVFPPRTDTELIIEHMKVGKESEILDITTGSGVVAIVAGLKGATGLAVDINPEAVKNANANLKELGLQIKTIRSDVFGSVPRKKFDIIFCNPPYLEGEIRSLVDYGIFGTKRLIKSLLENAPRYLKKNGRVLIVFAEWGEFDYFKKSLEKSVFKHKIIGEKSSTSLNKKYFLYELTI